MKSYDELLDHISALEICDTHEHLPTEARRSAQNDVLAEWLIHYFPCDLVSAGLSDAALAEAQGTRKPLLARWKLVEPYWHAAESTGYGRALTLAARDIYGIPEISAKSIEALNERFVAARAAGGHYRRVLKDMSRIAVSIRDEYDAAEADTSDPFVFTLRTHRFISVSHYNEVCAAGREVDLSVHTLGDWVEVTRRHVEKAFARGSRIVCLKCALAYDRSLRHDKVTFAEAEKEFNRLFEDRHLPTHRPGVRLGPVFENYMQHVVCGIADDMSLPYQFHTGIQEGNGNVIYDANPTLLSNLFIEYKNVKFDLFHMGYPYVMELGNLAKNFRNVHIDMCWGNIVSPEAARRALVEWLDAVPANKISAFGGDYAFVDGVYGHQYLARRNVASALAQKVDDGSFGMDRAREIATWLFVDNPKRTFGLAPHMGKEKAQGKKRG